MTIRGYTSGIPKNAKSIARRARAALKTCANEMEGDLQKVVATSEWVHVERTDSKDCITVKMAGKTAEWLVRGRGPRTLPDKGSPYVFQPRYQRKTIPGQFTSRAGGPIGPKVFAYGPIKQKAVEPGQWPGLSVKKVRPKLKRKLLTAVRSIR